MTNDFTLKDIENLILASETRLHAHIEKRFEDGKAYTDERFNWLATKLMEAVAYLENKIEESVGDSERGIRKDMKEGFTMLNNKIDVIKYNHEARLEILEDKVL